MAKAEGCVVLTSVLGEADPLVFLEAVLHTLLLVLILLILLVLMVLHGLHLISTNTITNISQYSPLPPVSESAAVLPCCLANCTAGWLPRWLGVSEFCVWCCW